MCVWLYKEHQASSQGIQLALYDFKLEEREEKVEFLGKRRKHTHTDVHMKRIKKPERERKRERRVLQNVSKHEGDMQVDGFGQAMSANQDKMRHGGQALKDGDIRTM